MPAHPPTAWHTRTLQQIHHSHQRCIDAIAGIIRTLTANNAWKAHAPTRCHVRYICYTLTCRFLGLQIPGHWFLHAQHPQSCDAGASIPNKADTTCTRWSVPYIRRPCLKLLCPSNPPHNCQYRCPRAHSGNTFGPATTTSYW